MSKSLALVTALTISSAYGWNIWGNGNSETTWTGPFNTDIYGTGMDGGTTQWSLSACQQHCKNKYGCQAAQYSSWQKYNGRNCFIYNNQNDNNPRASAISGFQLYKLTKHQSPHTDGNWKGPYYADVYGTGLDGGSYQWSLSACKQRCRSNSRCKAAQFSQNQRYNGFNCFIYQSDNANRPQLKDFKLWKYTGHSDSWGPPIRGDINGIGLGGSWAGSVHQCKQRCEASYNCKAAQFCQYCNYHGKNCFIYDNQNVNNPQLQSFVLYKYNRAGCNGIWGCLTGGRLYNAKSANWVETDKEDEIANIAMPALLSISAVLGVVGVVRFVRARRTGVSTVEHSDEGQLLEAEVE